MEFLIQLKSVLSLSRISFNPRYANYVDFLADPEFVANSSLSGGPRSGGATLPPWRVA